MVELLLILGLMGVGSLVANLFGDEADDDASARPDPNDDEVPGRRAEGGAENDLITGTADEDTLSGGAGNDTLRGGDDEDLLIGGDGNDHLFGEADEDTLQGGAGNDLLVGGEDDDSLSGGDGDDKLRGGAGDDSMMGESGDDLLLGGAGNDLIQGGQGSDVMEGGRGTDRLEGGEDDDLLVGLTLANGQNVVQSAASSADPGSWGTDLVDPDTLLGGEGDDLIILGRGDAAFGGAGADSFLVGPWMDAANAGVISDFDPARDELAVFLPDSYQGAGAITVTTAGADALVRVDGAVLARVTGAAGILTPALITLTSAEDLVV